MDVGDQSGPEPGPIERVEVELIVVGQPETPDPAVPGPSLAEQVRRGYEVVREHAAEVHAADGYRPGATPAATSTRRGGDCDIVRSMRVDPWTAASIAGSRAFRRHDHRFLRFDEAERGDDRALTWRVIIWSQGLRPVPATLHLRAAPSMVLSVLELVPRRKLRWRRAAFIDAGVEAVEALAHDFQAACDTT